MSYPILEDACYQVDILERVLSKEIALLKRLEDALEACLVGAFAGEVTRCLKDGRDIYAKLLNLAPTYMGN